MNLQCLGGNIARTPVNALNVINIATETIERTDVTWNEIWISNQRPTRTHFRQNTEATQAASKRLLQKYWRELEAWPFHQEQSSSYIKGTPSNTDQHPIQVISPKEATLVSHNVTFGHNP